jgi:hypothetical protein
MRIFLASVASLLVAASLSSTAGARPIDHRGAVGVCADGWVEAAPAHRPIAPAYPGDRFTVTRSRFAIAHHSDGTIERFALGRLAHRDSKSHHTYLHAGWVSTRILAGGRSCADPRSL